MQTCDGIYLVDDTRQKRLGRVSIEAIVAGSFDDAAAREAALQDFLRLCGWAKAERISLGQDASTRSYSRLRMGNSAVLLMDAPRLEAPVAGPGADEQDRRALGWNAIARLAACRIDAFVCVGAYLDSIGLSVPRVEAFDVGRGFALVEDFGPGVFAEVLRSADLHDEAQLYAEVGRALALVYRAGLPSRLTHRGLSWPVFQYDAVALRANVDLFIDWQPKYDAGVRLTERDRSEWQSVTDALIAQAMSAPRAFTVRDVMSENLIWLPRREGIARVGFLDFQDALAGWASWDFAMLVQDARRDVGPEAGEAAVRAFLEDTGLDEATFREEFALLGAINALRILGVFARLIWRDGKPKYAAFMAREWKHLKASLRHSALADLRAFLEASCEPLQRLT